MLHIIWIILKIILLILAVVLGLALLILALLLLVPVRYEAHLKKKEEFFVEQGCTGYFSWYGYR